MLRDGFTMVLGYSFYTDAVMRLGVILPSYRVLVHKYHFFFSWQCSSADTWVIVSMARNA